MPGKNVPEGWYLVGVIVSPQYRRRGVATELIRQRLLLISYMADEAYYFANALNLVTIELHERFGIQGAHKRLRLSWCHLHGRGRDSLQSGAEKQKAHTVR